MNAYSLTTDTFASYSVLYCVSVILVLNLKFEINSSVTLSNHFVLMFMQSCISGEILALSGFPVSPVFLTF